MDIEAALVTVKPLLERIKKEGEKAVIAITAEIDGVDIPQLRVPATVIQKALDELDVFVNCEVWQKGYGCGYL